MNRGGQGLYGLSRRGVAGMSKGSVRAVSWRGFASPVAAARAAHPRAIRQAAALRRGYASPTAPSSDVEAAIVSAQVALDEGTNAFMEGKLPEAIAAFERSLSAKATAIAYYNLGVVYTQTNDLPNAIDAFTKALYVHDQIKESLNKDESSAKVAPTQAEDDPDTGLNVADTHTNLGAAHILSQPPNTDLALYHLQRSLFINPDDGQVCYNLGAVLEVMGKPADALLAFEKALSLGVDRAATNIAAIKEKTKTESKE